jgi:hypothetical protein
MEKISIERLESLNGGGFISGFCAGVSVIRFGAMVRIPDHTDPPFRAS